MENNVTPSQYFDFIKGSKKQITSEALQSSFDVFIKLAEKYSKLGQLESLKKLSFLADTLVKEEQLIKLGITTYIYKDTIQDYIDTVADKTVKIIELSRYMREVPDELVDVVEKTREIFDEFYVVFTDYTGQEERRVEQERRDKDPILFGVFKNSTNVSDRFYFLGDWVDEYCDLTLDKMVEQYKENKKVSPSNEIAIPKTSEELIDLMKSYVKKTSGISTYSIKANDGFDIATDLPMEVFKYDNKPVNQTKKSFFDKVRNVLKTGL